MSFDIPQPSLQDAQIALMTKEHNKRMMKELKAAFKLRGIDFNEKDLTELTGIRKGEWTHYSYKGIFLLKISDFKINFKTNTEELLSNTITIEGLSYISFNEHSL